MKQLIVASTPSVERVERFQSLSAGQYWRAKEKVVGQGIASDEVLLITSIRWVDEKPHTIILRSHPNNMGKSYEVEVREKGRTYAQYREYGEHRFLLDDFLKSFEFEPQAENVRSSELMRVQQKIAALQTELIETQADPQRMKLIVEAGLREDEAKAAEEKTHKRKSKKQSGQLPVAAADEQRAVQLATGTVVNAIGAGITEAGIEQMRQAANRQHQIASVQASWIQGKTEEIAETITAMTPYFEEKAAAALALTEETRNYVAKLMKGIESLDLYVGKGVEVVTLRSGASAPQEVPLTFMQRKLLMDEELAIWADVDASFDFSREEIFFEALLNHPKFVDQIFPTPRCVLVMAATRRDIDYGDPWVNNARNEENRKVFLMVRDGENLYRIFSPVESHLGAARLFPMEDDDQKIFRGLNGSEIKFDDVAFTDRLKVHEAHALHYKRFLLLCCGLDHRLKLFGEFYPGPPSLEFMSLEFQAAYMRFAHDDAESGRLLGESRPDVMKWIQDKNRHLRSGSRVLCNWRELMNPATAPGACRESTHRHGEFHLQYRPKHKHDVVIAYRDGQSLCVDIEVHGETVRYRDRFFTCKVNLSNFKEGRWEYTDQPFLCLDTVSAEEVRWYIHNRDARRSHLDYIRFFKRALAHLEQEHAEEAGAREALAKALEDGRIATGKDAVIIIDQAVVAWRAANRGKVLPKYTGTLTPDWQSLLDQLYMLAGNGARQVADVEAFVREFGYAPLRLVLSGGAKLVVYAAPANEEHDDRLTPHFWVHSITLERGRKRLKEKSRRWALLPKQSASETTIHEWPGCEEWIFAEAGCITLAHKRQMMATASTFCEQFAPFVNSMTADEHAQQMKVWQWVRTEILRNSRYVRNPVLAVPIGVIYYPKVKELRYLCVGTSKVHGLLHRATEDASVRQALRAHFVDAYGLRAKGEERYDEDVRESNPWCLLEITESIIDGRNGAYLMKGGQDGRLDGKSYEDPRLGQWLTNFMEETKEYAKVWIAPGVFDESGNCQLDALLHNQIPADFEPTDIQVVTLVPNDGQTLPKYAKWYDITARTCARKRAVTPFSTDKPDGVGHYGYSSSHYFESSRAAARAFVQEQVEGTSCLVPAAELADAPQVPAGVERWYVVDQPAERT